MLLTSTTYKMGNGTANVSAGKFGNWYARDFGGNVMSQIFEADNLAKLTSEEQMAMVRVQELVDGLRAVYQLEAEILQGSAAFLEEISKADPGRRQ
jgi:hypothetical protein